MGKARPLVVAHLFETELLLTLRERELALDASASLARAMAVAHELPPSLEADRYLAIVEAVPNDDSGWPRRESENFRRERAPFVPRDQRRGRVARDRGASPARAAVRGAGHRLRLSDAAAPVECAPRS